MEKKIDDYGIGHRWLAMMQSVSEQQQRKHSCGMGAGSMILLELLRAHATTRRSKIAQSSYFGRYTTISISILLI